MQLLMSAVKFSHFMPMAKFAGFDARPKPNGVGSTCLAVRAFQWRGEEKCRRGGSWGFRLDCLRP
jgi:hypothetical protein